MSFVKGDVVKLVGYEKSYTVLVTDRHGVDEDCFAGVITSSEYPPEKYNGALTVGTYDLDFTTEDFELVDGE